MLILSVYLNISLQGPCIKKTNYHTNHLTETKTLYRKCKMTINILASLPLCICLIDNIQVLVFNSIISIPNFLSKKSSDAAENITSEMQQVCLCVPINGYSFLCH